jgi:hypothetical protein
MKSFPFVRRGKRVYRAADPSFEPATVEAANEQVRNDGGS